MTARRLLALLAAVLVAAAVAVGASTQVAVAADQYGAVGEVAPDFAARQVGTQDDWSLQEDGAGKVVLLNVWATWCVPCRKEMPDLAKLQQEFDGELEIVGVSVDDEGYDRAVQKFARNVGVDFLLLRDEDKDVQRTFRTSGVPESILVDADGRVAYRWKGPITFDAKTERIVQRAIDGEADYAKEAKKDVDSSGIGILSALLAGLLSFLSPCVLPLVPSYAAFLGAAGPEASRRSFMLRGTAFVSGFSVVFIALGVAATAAGGLALDAIPWIARVGGALLVLLGFATLGVLRLPGFETDSRVLGRAMTRVGNGPGGAFVIGSAFAAGWTPCIGPILAGILTLAASTGDVWRGAVLLTAYSVGLAVPFIITTIVVARVPTANRRIARIAPVAQKIAGALLVVVGLLLLSGQLSRLAALSSEVMPWTVG